MTFHVSVSRATTSSSTPSRSRTAVAAALRRARVDRARRWSCFAVNVVARHARPRARRGHDLRPAAARAGLGRCATTAAFRTSIAANEHDLFFAQGYVEGSDRLFQMDLLRRYMLGELAEVFGSAALATDETQRAVPCAPWSTAQWRRLDASIARNPRRVQRRRERRDRARAVARRVPAARVSAATVDAAGFARRRRWRPCSILSTIGTRSHRATRRIARRTCSCSTRAFRFTDPCYDAPVLTGLAARRAGSALQAPVACCWSRALPTRARRSAATSGPPARTSQRGRRALLANDPHLGLQMPGVWYLIDLRAPDFTSRALRFRAVPPSCSAITIDSRGARPTARSRRSPSSAARASRSGPAWQTERFAVRFRATVDARYYRTHARFRHDDDEGASCSYAGTRTPIRYRPRHASSLSTARRRSKRRTARAREVSRPDAKLRAGRYRADASRTRSPGRFPTTPYAGAGSTRYRDLPQRYPLVSVRELPKVAPSRDAIVWTANNKMYGAGVSLRR